jgi:hypothetical protein
MGNIKTLTLAAVTALSLGFGTATAQESSGAVGPYERAQLNKLLAQQAAAGSPSAVVAQGNRVKTSSTNH